MGANVDSIVEGHHDRHALSGHRPDVHMAAQDLDTRAVALSQENMVSLLLEKDVTFAADWSAEAD